MKSVGQLGSSLSEIVNAIKTVDGVIGVILFGSVARGEADEGSDIDLFVLFVDEDSMRRNEWEVTRRVPSEVFAQIICACPSTLEKVNPVFLQSVLEDGLILYSQYPLIFKSRLMNATAFLIVRYSLEGLPQKVKQKLSYRLFGSEVGGRRYFGLVEQGGGRHLGRGCLLIQKEKAEDILNALSECGVKYEIIETYTPNKVIGLADTTRVR